MTTLWWVVIVGAIIATVVYMAYRFVRSICNEMARSMFDLFGW